MQGANHGVGELGRYKGRHNRIPKKQVDLGKARERRKKNLTEEPLGSQDTEDTPRTMAQTGTCWEEALAWWAAEKGRKESVCRVEYQGVYS